MSEIWHNICMWHHCWGDVTGISPRSLLWENSLLCAFIEHWLLQYRFSRFNTVPACVSWKDGQKVYDGIALITASLCWCVIKISGVDVRDGAEMRWEGKGRLQRREGDEGVHTVVDYCCFIITISNTGPRMIVTELCECLSWPRQIVLVPV